MKRFAKGVANRLAGNVLQRRCHICKVKRDKNAGGKLPAGSYDKAGVTYTFSIGVWVCDSCRREIVQ
jgi:hypothetical protein